MLSFSVNFNYFYGKFFYKHRASATQMCQRIACHDVTMNDRLNLLVQQLFNFANGSFNRVSAVFSSDHQYRCSYRRQEIAG